MTESMTLTQSTPLPIAAPIARESNAHVLLQILQQSAAAGITKDNVEALERMAQLMERQQDREARRDFFADLKAMQDEMRLVEAKRVVPNDNGTARFKFASFEDLMLEVQPILRRHGFSIRWDQEINGKYLVMVCILSHSSGHEDRTRFAVPADAAGPPKTSAAQAMGSNASYAKRRALCDALNIVVDHDGDARGEGDYITPEQAAALRARVTAIHGDVPKFLKAADARTFEEIRTGRMDQLVTMLTKKELSTKKTGEKPADGPMSRPETAGSSPAPISPLPIGGSHPAPADGPNSINGAVPVDSGGGHAANLEKDAPAKNARVSSPVHQNLPSPEAGSLPTSGPASSKHAKHEEPTDAQLQAGDFVAQMDEEALRKFLVGVRVGNPKLLLTMKKRHNVPKGLAVEQMNGGQLHMVALAVKTAQLEAK